MNVVVIYIIDASFDTFGAKIDISFKWYKTLR